MITILEDTVLSELVSYADNVMSLLLVHFFVLRLAQHKRKEKIKAKRARIEERESKTHRHMPKALNQHCNGHKCNVAQMPLTQQKTGNMENSKL